MLMPFYVVVPMDARGFLLVIGLDADVLQGVLPP
jgi:hypothetical protein